jgi:hypothetical protein
MIKRMIKGHPTESLPRQARESQGLTDDQGASDTESDGKASTGVKDSR